MNFSYPSLEEPKPPTPPQPEPEAAFEPDEPSVPTLVNGVAPAEPPTSKTSMVAQKLPDTVDSPVISSTNSWQDLSKKGPTVGTSIQSPAAAKAFPQVFYLTSSLIESKTKRNPTLSHLPILVSQFDRTKKPSVRLSDEPKTSQNGSVKNSTPNGPVVPDRSVKPPFIANTSLSKEEQSQIHSEAVAVMEKARQEQEKRNQLRRAEEERREKEQKEKELKERQENEEHERKKKEEEEKGHQEKKTLERQRAEEEDDKENKVWEEKEKRGKEQNPDTPSKSMSLDSPAPNHIVSEIKVSPLQC